MASQRSFLEDYEYQYELFDHYYRCYPFSYINRPSLENGDKIIMPPSALDKLASLKIEYPMLFELRNPFSERAVTHCGVLEFVAEEGFVYMPNWMMENMRLQEGGLVKLRNVTLAKGTFTKLRPHTKDFLDISDPKAVLETSLRSYSCLTTGDTIMIGYNNKKYYIDVVETRPSSAVSVIETDCEVDFAPPLDYEEPQKKLTANTTKSSKRANGKLVFGGASANTTPTQPKPSLKSTSQDSSQKEEEPKFQAFMGKKYTLS